MYKYLGTYPPFMNHFNLILRSQYKKNTTKEGISSSLRVMQHRYRPMGILRLQKEGRYYTFSTDDFGHFYKVSD